MHLLGGRSLRNSITFIWIKRLPSCNEESPSRWRNRRQSSAESQSANKQTSQMICLKSPRIDYCLSQGFILSSSSCFKLCVRMRVCVHLWTWEAQRSVGATGALRLLQTYRVLRSHHERISLLFHVTISSLMIILNWPLHSTTAPTLEYEVGRGATRDSLVHSCRHSAHFIDWKLMYSYTP